MRKIELPYMHTPNTEWDTSESAERMRRRCESDIEDANENPGGRELNDYDCFDYEVVNHFNFD